MAAAALLFGAVTGLDLTLQSWNEHISLWLQGPAEYALTVVGVVTQFAFSAEFIGLAAALGGLVLVLRRRWLLALSLALVFGVMACEVALKYIIHQAPAPTYLAVRVLVPAEGVPAALQHGFPSGHASRAAFAIGWLALTLTWRARRGWILSASALVLGFVCWTRIYVGDHSLLEIVAGIILAGFFLAPAYLLACSDLSVRQPRSH